MRKAVYLAVMCACIEVLNHELVVSRSFCRLFADCGRWLVYMWVSDSTLGAATLGDCLAQARRRLYDPGMKLVKVDEGEVRLRWSCLQLNDVMLSKTWY